MAVEFVAKTEVKPGGGSSIQISIPTGWSVGDVLIACITKDDNDAITPPAGWTVIQNVTGGTAMRLWTGYRIAESGDTNWTWSGDSETYYGVILCYKGNAAAPIHASGSNSGSDAVPIAPSVAFTDLEVSSLVFQCFGADRDRTPYTMASQLSSKFNDGNSGAGGCGGAGGDRVCPMSHWLSPTGHNDPNTSWTGEGNAYDENTTTNTTQVIDGESWSSYLELTIAAISCSKVRFWALYSVDITQISLDVYYSSAWHNIYEGAFADKEWVEKAIGSTQDVTAMRVKFYNDTVGQDIARLYEADFWRVETATGNTGTATFAQDASDEWAAVTMVIEAAAAAGVFYKSIAGAFTATGSIVKLPKITLTGVFSSVGSIARKISLGLAGTFGLTGIVSSIFKFPKSLGGVFGLTGVVSKLPKISLSGIISPTGAVSSIWKAFKSLAGTFGLTGTLGSVFKYFKSIAGVFGLTGTVIKLPKITLMGVLSATGVIVKLPKIALNGVFDFTGSLLRKIIISLAGTFNLTGAVSDIFKRFVSLAGTFSLTGTVTNIKKIFKSLTGSFNFTGSIIKLPKIILSGVLSITGVVSSIWKSFKSLAGTFNLTGVVTKLPKMNLSGVFDFTGSLGRKIYYSLVGAFSSTGSIVAIKKIFKSLAGVFTFTGIIVKLPKINLSGTFNLTGIVGRLIKKSLSGVLTFTGDLAGQLIGVFYKSLSGAFGFSGTLGKLVKISLSGILSSTGIVNSVKTIFKALTGVFNFTGSINGVKRFIKVLTGVFDFSGNVGRLIKKTLSGAFTLTGYIYFRNFWTKITKALSTYTKVDRTDKGWFAAGWFSQKGWLSDIYTKVTKGLSAYTKSSKGASSYTKVNKDSSNYTKSDK